MNDTYVFDADSLIYIIAIGASIYIFMSTIKFFVKIAVFAAILSLIYMYYSGEKSITINTADIPKIDPKEEIDRIKNLPNEIQNAVNDAKGIVDNMKK